jgi:hypothetical protein
MRRFAIVVVLGFAMIAASVGGCAGGGNVTRRSVGEKQPYRSMTYSAHIDQIMRAKTGYPW